MDGWVEFTLDKPTQNSISKTTAPATTWKQIPFAPGVVSSFFTHGCWWAQLTHKHQVPPACLTPGTCLTNSGYFLKQILFSIIYSQAHPTHVCPVEWKQLTGTSPLLYSKMDLKVPKFHVESHCWAWFKQFQMEEMIKEVLVYVCLLGWCLLFCLLMPAQEGR